MIKLLCRKALYDGWDNFHQLLLSNFVWIVSILLSFFFISYTSKMTSLVFYCSVLAILYLFSLIIFLTGAFSYSWSSHNECNTKQVFKQLKNKSKYILVSFLILSSITIFVTMIIPIGFISKSIIGTFVSIFFSWIVLILVLSMQYYVAFSFYQENNTTLQNLKNSLAFGMIFPGYSLFVLFYSILNICISLPLAFVIPGFAGISVLQMDAFRLAIIKFTKKQSESVEADIFQEEILLTGRRSFRELFFPWKLDNKDKNFE